MALILDALIEILRKPTIGGVVTELAIFAAPLWLAVFAGLVVGWVWKPRWAAGLVGGGKGTWDDDPKVIEKERSNGSGLQISLPSLDSLRAQLPNCITYLLPEQRADKELEVVDLGPPPQENEKLAVSLADLQKLSALIEVTDDGPAWIQMMDKSLPNMSYQAWRRDPETGPPQYRSRTVFDDATPEQVRDFFWDDEFRIKSRWDDMLLHHETLEECPVTGTMLVHWVRKFPFFCSDREYNIGRRIWNVDGAYYCVTKGVPCHSVPRKNKPRRVDLYYSSWCIRASKKPYLYVFHIWREILIICESCLKVFWDIFSSVLIAVESRQGDGQMNACEVLLFHFEDMGIPWEIAKLGVRQGMWACVKKLEPGLRAYQAARKSGEPLPPCAKMAQINTKITIDHLRSLGSSNDISDDIVEAEKEKPWGSNIPKFLIIGGAVALACSLDRGLLTKAVIFGVARRFGKIGKRL